MQEYQEQVINETKAQINQMTNEINLRFNALNTELVGSFDSFAGVQSSFKKDTIAGQEEMAKIRNQIDSMDK